MPLGMLDKYQTAATAGGSTLRDPGPGASGEQPATESNGAPGHWQRAGARSRHAADVERALAALSWARIGAALGLTGASYLLLMLYDALALRHLRKTLPFRRVALASFTSYAFTHSFGFGSILHATIRYRLYAPQGLKTVDIAEITAFVNITLMIGLAIMFPVIALVDASALEGMGLPRSTSLIFGAGALVLAAVYVAIGWWVERLEVFGFAL